MSPTLFTIDRGTGPPVLLLHGQPGTGSSWSAVIDQLTDEFRVLAPDRIGNGRSPGEGGGLSANAAAIADFLLDVNAAPATVVGHSWGGGVAILLASRYPWLVRSLVLVGSVGTADTVNGLDRLLATHGVGDALTIAGLGVMGGVLPRIRRLTPRLPNGAGRYLEAILPDEGLSDGLPGAWGRTKRTFVIEQRALLDELEDMEQAMTEVEVPTSVVIGEWDLVVPPQSADTLSQAIRGSELIRLPRIGHFVPRDAAGALAEVIRATDARADDRPARSH
jgi:pimeloyl-ACP methyl ester carboxylesterase